MPEWWTYRLSDFLMFSQDTYLRLMESYNRALFPMQAVAGILGLGYSGWMLRRSAGDRRLIFGVLAFVWLLVGWAFHWQRFQDINLAAGWYAAGWGLQAALMVGLGVLNRSRPDTPAPDKAGVALIVFAVIGLPAIGALLGHRWAALEFVGTAPDPTAVATFGVLLALRAHPVLLIIPLLWSLVSGATLWAMESPDAWVLPLVAVFVGVRRTRPVSRPH